MEVRFRIAERGAAQGEKAIDVPRHQHALVGVEIDREVEEIRDEWDRLAVFWQPAGLQHIEALDDQNVGAVDLDPLLWHHVIDQVRIDRRAHRTPTGFHVG